VTGRDRDFIEGAARTLRPLLEGARTAALCTPDGDGISMRSACSITSVDRPTARIINSDPLPLRYRFLDPDGAVEVWNDGDHRAFVRDANLLFMLDNSATNRLGPLETAIRESRARTICIDHHNVLDPFWSVNIVDEEACATGELVFQILKELGWTPPRAAAEAAYVSLVTDTGYFRFSKTSPRCHQAAAEMLEAAGSVRRGSTRKSSPGATARAGAARRMALAGTDRERPARLDHPDRDQVERAVRPVRTPDVINEPAAHRRCRSRRHAQGWKPGRKPRTAARGLDVNRMAGWRRRPLSNRAVLDGPADPPSRWRWPRRDLLKSTA
jgi:hypothetical protein